jgi:hypothetical protein
VSWFAVHEYVEALSLAGDHPIAGTPDWCALPDDDPRKLAAVLDAGRRDALRIETEQQERAQASRDIAASTDWAAVARSISRGRGGAYVPRSRAS